LLANAEAMKQVDREVVMKAAKVFVTR
jgi:hypothetical protein